MRGHCCTVSATATRPAVAQAELLANVRNGLPMRSKPTSVFPYSASMGVDDDAFNRQPNNHASTQGADDVNHPHGAAGPASGSKVLAAIKNPVWATVGTVVGVLAIGVSGFAYLQANSSSEGRLRIAAVTLDEPVDVAAIELSANGQPEGNRPLGDVAVAPIDVTFKNDGGSVASINQVSATVVKSEHILSCLQQGAGGVGVAAEYALKIPRGQLFEEGVREQTSTGIDFKVDPGETGRFVVTVGPEDQAANAAVIMAVRLTFTLSDGGTLETDPVVIGTTQNFIDELVAEVAGADPGNENVGRFCPRELEKIDNVVSVGSQHAKSVDELREAYQRASDPRSVAPGGPAAHTAGPQELPTGDLGLRQPISTPQCNGQGIVILGNVTTPGSYPRWHTSSPRCPPWRVLSPHRPDVPLIARRDRRRQPDLRRVHSCGQHRG